MNKMAGCNSKSLDLAFAMDCTGSMGSYIESAKTNIIQIVDKIVSSEKGDVQLAFVGYRDHPPQDTTFVTERHDFTHSSSIMKGWLSAMSASGGGDTPEAVADGLRDSLNFSWRSCSTKICVLIADAPPHGIGNSCSDGFPNGCPLGIDPLQVVSQMAQKGITLYVAGCEPSINSYKSFFMGLAHKTGGQYVPLTNARSLADMIVGGAREEMDMERLMGEVDGEVKADLAAGRVIDEAEMTRRVHAKMAAKGVTSKQLYRNKAELESAVQNPEAATMSTLTSIAEVKEFKTKVESGGGLSGLAGVTPPTAALSRLTVKSTPTTDAVEECFDVEEKPVTVAQTNRLVKKSLARNMVNKK